MNSALLNKIKILKPRKKYRAENSLANPLPGSQSNAPVPKRVEDKLPEIKLPQINNPTSENPEKKVKVYLLNVPNNFNQTKKNEVKISNDVSTVQSVPVSNTQILFIQPQSTLYTQNNTTQNYALIPNGAVSTSNVASNNSSIGVSNSVNKVTNVKVKTVNVNTNVNCFICPAVFKSFNEMQAHYLAVHKNKKRQGIKNDGKVIARKLQFEGRSRTPNMGVSKAVDDEGEPKCHVCSIYFKSKEEVKQHMATVHSYKCSECHNTFYTLFQFTDHKCTIKKKKVKSVKPKRKKVTVERDPLAISLNDEEQVNFDNFVNTVKERSFSAKEVVNCSRRLSYPEPISKNSVQSKEKVAQPIERTQFEKKPKEKENKKSLINCTYKELTSKDLIQSKLQELVKNPNFTINFVKKEVYSSNPMDEFTCGRCNVPCVDSQDYVSHIEQCFKLSNVSMITTNSPPQKMLKLKSKILPKRSNSNMTGINCKLMAQLKESLGTRYDDLFEENNSLKSGNSSKTSTENSLKSKHFESIPLSLTQSIKRPLSSASVSDRASNFQHPMVVIPLPSSEAENQNNSNSDTMTNNSYIKVTDEKNNLTWNFSGSSQTYIGRDPPNTCADGNRGVSLQLLMTLNEKSVSDDDSDSPSEYGNLKIKSEPSSPQSSKSLQSDNEINIGDIKMELVDEDMIEDNI